MYPIDRGEEGLQRYLTRLLIAAVHAAGGELRIPSKHLRQVEDGEFLHKDYDVVGDELVLRAGSKHSETYVITRSQQWDEQAKKTAQPRSQVKVWDDEALATAEEKRDREAALRALDTFRSA